MFSNIKKKLIGDKAFYAMVLAVVIPILVQNGITNFVGLLDNIMVGSVGTNEMSGVAIVNQLMFVFNITVFGILSGAGIFSAQFWGCEKPEGVKHAFRFKLISIFIVTVLAILLFFYAGDTLISLYLNDAEPDVAPQALADTLFFGKQYLLIMLLGLPPFALCQCYTSTLRECGETVLPMKASMAAVLINMCLNAVLIFGLLGMPKLGVVGAAIATVISRYVEFLVVLLYSHKNVEKYPFMKGLYSSAFIPKNLIGKIVTKGTPLMLNEICWAVGMATLAKCYSERGLDVVAAQNISSTINNLFAVLYITMGSAVSIIIGQLLGAGKMEEAKDQDRKLIAFSVFVCVIGGMILLAISDLFPMIYNTEPSIKKLAGSLIRIIAFFVPVNAFLNTCYFTIRAGGKTIITFLFDSAFMWLISIPVAFVLTRMTTLPILPLFLGVQMLDLIKCFIGYVMVKKGIWISNIVVDD